MVSEKQSREITFAEGAAVFAVLLVLIVSFLNARIIEYELEKTDERLKRLEKINHIDEIGRAR